MSEATQIILSVLWRVDDDDDDDNFQFQPDDDDFFRVPGEPHPAPAYPNPRVPK